MLQSIASYVAKALQRTAQARRPGFPTYRQVLHGGFGAAGGRYQLEMNTYPFKEEDISVKVTPGQILVEGRMEDRVGEDFMMYVFSKKCPTPAEVDVRSVEYKFQGDRLVLTARTNK